ncbi:MAG TPA: hypothetical protein VK404_04180 [Spirosoma sp.]|jgi:hypothetical protein|nr:hypothetical protein [Spirosoma sp.]
MKLLIFFLFTWYTTTANLGTIDEPVIKVIRTATDNQIRGTELQVLQQYGLKVQVKVIKRNSNGEITDLKLIRYDKAGRETGSCESDNFGLLVITRNGCKIADVGYEKHI